MNYPIYAVAFLQAASDEAAQLLHDALAMGSPLGYVIAALAALAIIVPIVLKALGKKVPLLDTIIAVVLGAGRSLTKPAPAPVQPEPTEAEKAKASGLEKVVDIKEEK